MSTTTPHDLYQAIEDMDVEKVRTLLDGDEIDINSTRENGNGASPLLSAALYGYGAKGVEVMRLLLEAGANPNQCNNYGVRPLHLVAQADATDKLLPLLEYGAKLDEQDVNGDTPIYRAACNGREEIGAALMQLGADTTLLNRVKKAPWQAEDVALPDRFVKALQQNEVPPHVDDYAQVDGETLLKKADNGLCALDAGLTWVQHGQWLPAMQSDAAFGLDALLEKGKLGMSYLERSIYNGAGQAVLEHLIQRGEHLQASHVLEPNGKPNTLVSLLTEKQLVQELFDHEAWAGQPVAQMEALYRALPDDARAQVKNFQALRIEMERTVQQKEFTR